MTSPAMRPLERSVRERLASHGVRFTPGRRQVLKTLLAADGPRSAAELQSTVDVPVSSLYRTLAVLEECGVIEPHHGLRGVTRYELAEWIRGHHHHVVCADCGSVDDVELDEETEKELAVLVGRVASSAGFAAIGHTLEVEGRCRRC